MKKRYLSFFLFFPFMGMVGIISCQSDARAGDRLELNAEDAIRPDRFTDEEPCDDLKRETETLDSVFHQILQRYEENAAFIEKIKASQELWEKTIDANLTAIFPGGDPAEYGSSQTLCRCTFTLQEIRARKLFLNTWTEGIPEGDVCRGSRELKKE